jgi:hypothetical protein
MLTHFLHHHALPKNKNDYSKRIPKPFLQCFWQTALILNTPFPAAAAMASAAGTEVELQPADPKTLNFARATISTEET